MTSDPLQATIVGTGPEGSALRASCWLVEFADGRRQLARVMSTLRNHRWTTQVAFELGQVVWVYFHGEDSSDCIIDIQRSEYRPLQTRPTGRPQYAESVIQSRVEEAKAKWGAIANARNATA